MTCGVKEPWGGHIRRRTKTAEGRLDVGKWAQVRPGDVLEIRLDDGAVVRRTVARVDRYGDVRSALERDLNALLPGVESVYEGLRIYGAFYDTDRPFLSIHMR